ncbi:alpha-glucan family phosphorylase [Marinitoga aeolica]|uniref:Alpha-glucan family phosphorylase n=1 Tax=Marinitoga aeolica TaxID=2809031 RepID=A0ABY8PR99_9BACT|nr:alpha-glucan family phosphorylase [Marinitoga aeolica]WGS65150.1 alpha-glucan family phosphorylase [Marinitoga aeolica]
MEFISKINVLPKVPEKLSRLPELSKNLWWTWNYDAQEIFERIDEDLWVDVNRNPVLFLKKVSQKKLNEASENQAIVSLYSQVIEKFDKYMKAENTWFKSTHREYKGGEFAYFCAEYGLHESFPNYSGGLGVLAGDHLKSSSDLGIPLVAVGLLYKQGYFEQRINSEGWQEAIFNPYDFDNFPVIPVKDEEGNELFVTVEMDNRKVYAKIWKLQVGRINLIYLDTDIPQNDPEDRMITYQLYGGDQEMRIRQEILLGIGGVRALRAMGYNPSVWHMNEGHSAFLGLERIREFVQEKGLSFREAVQAAKSSAVFTTHTPVPAGHDAFPFHLMDRYFKNYWPQLKASRREFLDLGAEIRPDGSELFSMTTLALNLSSRANGVSKLHGEVSRDLAKDIWKGLEAVEVPITHVTNGVHATTWISKELQDLFTNYLGRDWHEKIDDPDLWKKIDNIPDEELWNVRKYLKKKLISFIHERTKLQRMRHGETVEQLEEIEEILNPNALTIGFARRFATYKRATLIFKDLDRLKKILNNPERPVQLIFAGKAHPADKPGQELIKRIYEISRMPEFKDKIVFIENYDMNVARHLVSGVDIWLNNPRRPREASGTSGQKAGMNGSPNFSVLDGWWVEGYNGKNGWAIGDERDYTDLELQDRIDSVSIYNTLEKEIVPLYYDHNEELGVSREWIKIMKESIISVTSFFNTHRMLKEYTQKLYMTAAELGEKFIKEDFKIARRFASWVELLERNWDSIRIKVLSNVNEDVVYATEGKIEVKAEVYLPGIGPDSILTQIVLAKLEDNKVISLKSFDMKLVKEVNKDTYLYEGEFEVDERGQYGWNVRVVPYNPIMPYQHYLIGFVKYPQ